MHDIQFWPISNEIGLLGTSGNIFVWFFEKMYEKKDPSSLTCILPDGLDVPVLICRENGSI